MIEIAPICRSYQLFDLFPKCISINNNTIQDIVNSHLKTGVIKSLPQSDFHITRKNKPLDELTNKEIGNLGERASFRFLETFFSITFFKRGNFKEGFKVEYLNKYSEQFKPYDIKVGDRYFDVKTTRHKEESHFHISMQEAEFITQNFDKYYFIRVFPLRPSETYIGIQIAHDLGANFYTFKHVHKLEFYNAYEEAKSLAQLDGFLVKAEWLYNVLYKDSSALVRCFDLSADSNLAYSKKMEYYKMSLFDINAPDDIVLNYRKARLISALGMLYYKRDTIDFEVLLEQAYITEIVNEWPSHNLQEFLTGFCRNCSLLTIKYFTTKVILLKVEKYLSREVSDSMEFNRGVSNPNKHEEFVKFFPYFLLFDRIEKGESYDSFAYDLANKKEFDDEDIEDIIDKICQYNTYDSSRKLNVKLLIGHVKSMGVFDIPLRMSSF